MMEFSELGKVAKAIRTITADNCNRRVPQLYGIFKIVVGHCFYFGIVLAAIGTLQVGFEAPAWSHDSSGGSRRVSKGREMDLVRNIMDSLDSTVSGRSRSEPRANLMEDLEVISEPGSIEKSFTRPSKNLSPIPDSSGTSVAPQKPSFKRSAELAKPAAAKESPNRSSSEVESAKEIEPGQEIDEDANDIRFRSEDSCRMESHGPSSGKSSKHPSRRSRGLVLSDRSPESAFECVGFWSQKAEEAFEDKCHGKVTQELLMCIFLREQRGNLTMNACGNSGCGMAQMTSAGVQGVRNGLNGRRYGLLPQYREFFHSIGRPDLAERNPSQIRREDAMDMQQSVGMAATLLCAIHMDGARDQVRMAERYNGNPNSGIRLSYRNFASQCINDFRDGSISRFTRTGVLIHERSSRLRRKHRQQSRNSRGGRAGHRQAHRRS